MSDFLRATLESNLPKPGKKKTLTLGVWEKNLAGSIKTAFPNLACETGDTNPVVADLLRGLRQHSQKLIKKLQPGDIDRSIRKFFGSTESREQYLTHYSWSRSRLQSRQGQVLRAEAR